MNAITMPDAARQCAALAEAWRKFDTSRSALAVWVLSLPLPPDEIDRDNMARLQVAMRGVCGLLTEARHGFDNVLNGADSMGLELLFAGSFADMAESALWNYMDSPGSAPPAVADLAATAHQVLAYLAEFERGNGATRPPAAGPIAVSEGGAA